MPDVTQILEAIDAGDPCAAEQLLPLVYDELRKLAAAKLAREKPGQTLDATGLVHEAYLRLVRAGSVSDGDGASVAHASGSVSFANRRHFFAAAAEAMRRILVQRARERNSLKRGGTRRRVELEDVAAPTSDERLLALDDALTRLSQEDLAAAQVVQLRHFGGLGHEQIAATLGI